MYLIRDLETRRSSKKAYFTLKGNLANNEFYKISGLGKSGLLCWWALYMRRNRCCAALHLQTSFNILGTLDLYLSTTSTSGYHLVLRARSPSVQSIADAVSCARVERLAAAFGAGAVRSHLGDGECVPSRTWAYWIWKDKTEI